MTDCTKFREIIFLFVFLTEKQLLKQLLVIAEKNTNRHPAILHHFEAACNGADVVHFLRCQRPAMKGKVLVDAGRRDTLGDDTRAALQAPHQTVGNSVSARQKNMKFCSPDKRKITYTICCGVLPLIFANSKITGSSISGPELLIGDPTVPPRHE